MHIHPINKPPLLSVPVHRFTEAADFMRAAVALLPFMPAIYDKTYRWEQKLLKCAHIFLLSISQNTGLQL